MCKIKYHSQFLHVPCSCPCSVLAAWNLPRTCSASPNVNPTKTIARNIRLLSIYKIGIKVFHCSMPNVYCWSNKPINTRFHLPELIHISYIYMTESLPECPIPCFLWNPWSVGYHVLSTALYFCISFILLNSGFFPLTDPKTNRSCVPYETGYSFWGLLLKEFFIPHHTEWWTWLWFLSWQEIPTYHLWDMVILQDTLLLNTVIHQFIQQTYIDCILCATH